MFCDGTIIFGVGPIPAIINVPTDAIGVRVRQRGDDITTVFLRFRDRCERWHLKHADNGKWALDYCFARNYRGDPLHGCSPLGFPDV